MSTSSLVRAAALVVLTALAGCRTGDAPQADAGARLADAARKGEAPRDAIGRAGPVVLDLAGFRIAIDEARVLQFWRTGEPPPVEALRNAMLRRRVVAKALETRVVREEAARRGLAVPPERLAQALENFAAGRPLDAPLPEPAPDPGTIDARLAARYGTAPERARQVVVDLLYAGLLSDALLAETPDATLRRAWEDEETQARVDVVQVPRVPTTKEIDRAVRERAPAIAAFYEKNRERFQKPERALGRRVVVPVPSGADAAAREAARTKAEALRARVAGGEDLAKVASAETIEGERRRAGVVGPWTREQAPELFEMKQGELSPVRPHRLGFIFLRVESRIPATVRPLDDTTVQREVAAEILRDEDALPHARQVAERARELLRTDPTGSALDALVGSERLRRATTEPFPRAVGRVPGIGLAPELFEAVFKLTEAAPVTPVFTVRQDYVVARRVDFRAPDPAQWPQVRATFAQRWRERERPHVVDRWLNDRLRGEAMWIDGPRVDALTLDDLGVGAADAVKPTPPAP